jgi:hypothetical protein
MEFQGVHFAGAHPFVWLVPVSNVSNTIWGPIQKTATALVNTNQHLFQCSCIFFFSALWLYFTICTYIYICIVLATLETKCTPWNFIISRQRNTKSGKFASVTQHPMYFLVQKSVVSFILLSFFVELRVEPGSVQCSVWIVIIFTEIHALWLSLDFLKQSNSVVQWSLSLK